MATADFNAVGRRKQAIARVRLVPGSGNIIINKREIDNYFGLETLKMTVRQPLELTKTTGFDVLVTVYGGGLSGQSGAIRHGISRALIKANPELRADLKRAGFLTRDPRRRSARSTAKGARRAPVLQALSAAEAESDAKAPAIPRGLWRGQKAAAAYSSCAASAPPQSRWDSGGGASHIVLRDLLQVCLRACSQGAVPEHRPRPFHQVFPVERVSLEAQLDGIRKFARLPARPSAAFCSASRLWRCLRLQVRMAAC